MAGALWGVFVQEFEEGVKVMDALSVSCRQWEVVWEPAAHFLGLSVLCWRVLYFSYKFSRRQRSQASMRVARQDPLSPVASAQ